MIHMNVKALSAEISKEILQALSPLLSKPEPREDLFDVKGLADYFKTSPK